MRQDRNIRDRDRNGQQNIPGTFLRPEPVRRVGPTQRVRKVRAASAPPTFYRMLRRGTFSAEQSTPNQYVREHHEQYYYTLQIVWSGDIKFDYKDFILDNAEVASFISNMKLRGSGEMMLKAIMEQVNIRLRELGIPPIACKITVRGQSHEEVRNEAYLEYTQARPEHIGLLQ